MTACKKAILDEWLEEVVTVFRKTAENGVFTSVPALVLQRFFDSLSVLMSNCTRHVVMESLRVLLRFFRRYAPPDSSNANSDGRSRLSYAYAETKSYRCAFVLPATIYNLPPPMVRASDTDKKNPATTDTTPTVEPPAAVASDDSASAAETPTTDAVGGGGGNKRTCQLAAHTTPPRLAHT